MNSQNKTKRTLVGFCILAMMSSCESTRTEADDDFKRKNEKWIIENDAVVSQKTVALNPDGSTVKKVIVEKVSFISDAEKKIVTNENLILQLKKDKKASARTLRKIDDLDSENKAIRVRIDEFILEDKLRCEQFKTDVMRDVNLIEIELKDLDQK